LIVEELVELINETDVTVTVWTNVSYEVSVVVCVSFWYTVVWVPFLYIVVLVPFSYTVVVVPFLKTVIVTEVIPFVVELLVGEKELSVDPLEVAVV